MTCPRPSQSLLPGLLSTNHHRGLHPRNRSSRQSPQLSLTQKSFKEEQRQGKTRTDSIMFIISGQDLAAYRAFFQCVDRLEDILERVGVGRSEGTAARQSCQPFQEGKIGALDLTPRRAIL